MLPLQSQNGTLNMREAVTPSQRLRITLRYLANGNTFQDLKFICAIYLLNPLGLLCWRRDY